MYTHKLLGTTVIAVVVAIALLCAPSLIGHYRVTQLPTKTFTLNRDGSALGQIAELYTVSGAGKIWFVTEDVYGQRVLEMNGARSVDDILYRDTIQVPWNNQ